MDTGDLIAELQGRPGGKLVFGEPVEKDGTVVIPAAKVRSGGGMGRGDDAAKGSGSGGGYGLTARPAGAFVISGGKVAWRPAVDVNMIVAGGQLTALLAGLAIARALRARRKG
jgi:uncharacterized spore protein YtfJ